MIRVLIVEDSPVAQALLAHILGSDPHVQVVGIAGDGDRALIDVERLKPEVITMDIHMPNRNGFDTTRRIMETNPVPIVIVSGSYVSKDMDKSFRAMEAGAVAVVRKPRGIGHVAYPDDARELIRTVKAMSEVKVVRRWPAPGRREPPGSWPRLTEQPEIRMIAIGASTGGPPVLREIFSMLPREFRVPLLVVQHMSTGFMEGFVAWLCASTGLAGRMATHDEPILPGWAYFAPDGFHMLAGRNNRIQLSADAPEQGLRPSVGRLFRSVAETCGSNAAGVLLTGMGRDGAEEMRLLKEKGAVTVAQDRESSLVFGMPGEAVKLNAADFILSPPRIAKLLAHLAKQGDLR